MDALKKMSTHILLMIYVVVVLYPFVWVIFASLKTNQEIIKDPWGFPKSFHFENYIHAWQNAKIGLYFFNSFYISISASIFTILAASAASFAITRMRLEKLNKTVYELILLGLVIPPGALLIPLYSLTIKLHIYNTPMALLFPYVTFALPVTVYILSSFMRTIPSELEEASIMDGLNAFQLFYKIILPLTTPAVVTVFILNFIGNWNEFVMANFYISSDSLRTLPVGMVGFRNGFNTDYSQFAAGIVYSMAPVLAIYVMIQEKIIEGVTAGSVKG